MSRLLRAAGYEAALFAGGAEFLDSLGSATPACVVVDGNMPGMNGHEVLTRLSQRPVRVPAIVVSGQDSPEHRRSAAEAGAVAFFTKPFNPEALLAAIAAVIKD